MDKNKGVSAILIAILTLITGYSITAQSSAVSNPAAAATKKSAKSNTTKRAVKMEKKGKSKNKKIDDEVVRNGDTLILPMKYYGISPAVSDLARQNLPPVARENGPMQEIEPMEVLKDIDEPKNDDENRLSPVPVQTFATAPSAATQGTNFDGPGTGITGFSVNVAPPDTTMAVGPNHIVAWVNSQYMIFDKSGTKLLPGNGFVNGNSLFTGTGNLCETTNRGDPILQYDRLADRWFLSQFAFNTGTTAPYLQCIAVSTTNNPTGTYYRYTVSFGSTSPDGFNDYGKLGVWTDAYYTSYNVFGGSPAGSNTGAALCASNRTKMLAGDPTATTLCAPTTFYGGGASLLPADFEGTELPTNTSQGGIFLRQSTAPALRLLKLKPDFVNSTVTVTDGFGGAAGSFINLALPTTTRACNGASGACIAQPGTTNKLDTLADRLMYRLVYRNRGGTDSLIVTQSVDPDAAGARSSAIRWYEIRNPFSAAPTLYQNGTYDPGASGDRWMGSMAMDKFGNMLMGYSVTNAGTLLKPSIAVAGRLNGDAVNNLQAEVIDTTGGGSQTGTLTRWGDYSTMQIDPADDTTFWYTTQYLAADGTFNWRTRITSYKFPVTVTTATGSGNIDDATKWNNGVPSSLLNAVVPAGVTITVNAATTVNNLTVANGGNLVMNADLNVQGGLTLGTKIDTGANTLTLGCVSGVTGASTANYVIGNLKKDFCGVQPFTFPTGTTNGYSPVIADITTLGANPSSLTIKANQGSRAGMSSTQSLQRFWSLTETGDLTTNLTFNYLDPTDIAGTESNYALYRFVGSAGAAVTPFTLNAAANTISANGISSFSDWTVGSLAPLAADVSVSGRVLTPLRRGIANASVTFTDSRGESRSGTTNQIGRFLIQGLPSGETYIVTVSARRYSFAPQVFTLNSDLTGLIFTATP